MPAMPATPEPPPVPLTRWATASDGDRIHVHASAVAIDGKGVLIRGASGSGKSRLALELMTLGAELVADDGVRIDLGLGLGAGTGPFLERPDTATDLIESRGVGLLRAGPVCGRVPLALVVDLDTAEPDRLPPRRNVTTGQVERPLIPGAGHPFLAASVLWLLRHGRAAPPDDPTG